MKITKVRHITTAPDGIALVVVKVETDQPGLYGLGCATFTQRPTLVAQAVDDYLDPLLQGRDPANIEDLWHLMMVNSYWRNGPVLNNAVSGVDMALWDIKGKVANMPVYDLLGGKCREAAMVYRHADGRDPQEVLDNVHALPRPGRPGGALPDGRLRRAGEGHHRRGRPPRPDAAAGHAAGMERRRQSLSRRYYDPDVYARSVPKLFDIVRGQDRASTCSCCTTSTSGWRRLTRSAWRKALEPYRLFFLEDPLAPDQIEWFRRLREQSATPIAMGELHNNPLEWRPLIAEQLDRLHPRAHLATGRPHARPASWRRCARAFGVRTAWHGPGDVSPLGHAANLHLDLACHNFGIQEVIVFGEALREVFPGMPGAARRLPVGQRPTRLGHRYGRGEGGQVPDHHPAD